MGHAGCRTEPTTAQRAVTPSAPDPTRPGAEKNSTRRQRGSGAAPPRDCRIPGRTLHGVGNPHGLLYIEWVSGPGGYIFFVNLRVGVGSWLKISTKISAKYLLPLFFPEVQYEKMAYLYIENKITSFAKLTDMGGNGEFSTQKWIRVEMGNFLQKKNPDMDGYGSGLTKLVYFRLG